VARFQFVLLIHAHQPVGNFDAVLESAYAASYLPFIETLERHPAVRIGLHYSGPLLEWLEVSHPKFFDRLRALAQRGQIELAGGGFYEPVLIAIPPEDQREQIRRMADYIEQHFGARPRGIWLTERVWEPSLPSALAACAVEYALVDDHHFLSAGFAPAQLCGDYIGEDQGHTVRLFAGLKTLRYLIPFRPVEETVALLRELAGEHPGGMAAMGDDCEKFGVWPGTHKLCYNDGWLERFFFALESASEWLETATPSAALASRPPLGRADLPAASYSEMSGWALPTPARGRFESLAREFESRPDAQPFLSGGIWRNFFSKYSESNLLHMKMLRASRNLESFAAAGRMGRKRRERLESARALILRAQCNDAYWHGVFGGLYAPHLRTALWRSLVQAESILAAVAHGPGDFSECEQTDFDADGRPEIFLQSGTYAALISPHDGGTLPMLDFRFSGRPGGRFSRRSSGRSAGVTLINSLMRRPEAYHQRLRSASTCEDGAVSIHDQNRSKEPGLADKLVYDRWPRNAFRLLVFDAARNCDDYARIRLEENAGLAGGDYVVTSAGPDCVALRLGANPDWFAEKEFRFASSKDGFDVTCAFSVGAAASATAASGVVAASAVATTGASVAPSGADVTPAAATWPANGQLVGMEVVVNMLAPDVANRYFESAGNRHSLGFAGAIASDKLEMADQWQRVKVVLEAPGAREFWIAPIETISESEDGFERVYQGSQILAVWRPEFAGVAPWSATLIVRVSRISG
jgi:alpha-amylase